MMLPPASTATSAALSAPVPPRNVDKDRPPEAPASHVTASAAATTSTITIPIDLIVIFGPWDSMRNAGVTRLSGPHRASKCRSSALPGSSTPRAGASSCAHASSSFGEDPSWHGPGVARRAPCRPGIGCVQSACGYRPGSSRLRRGTPEATVRRGLALGEVTRLLGADQQLVLGVDEGLAPVVGQLVVLLEEDGVLGAGLLAHAAEDAAQHVDLVAGRVALAVRV